MRPFLRSHRVLMSIFVGAVFLTNIAFGQYAAQGVVLRSQITLATFGSTAGSSDWGYVSGSGREYALMGLNNKMAVVEITNPAAPVIVGSITHSSSSWCEVKTYGHYAYVSNETGGGIDVVDLGNVDGGAVTLVERLTASGISTTHTVSVDETSGFLYTNGSNVGSGRLLAWSLANPANPVFAGQMSSAQGGVYVHDSQVVTYASGPYAGQQIAFCCCGSTGLDIVNVTNKTSMVRLSRSTYPGLSYCHQGWLSADRHYFYVNDETDGQPTTRVFDVSNLAAPVLVSTFYTGVSTIDHNLYIRDGFIFESNYTSGLQIFDTAPSATSPLRVGFFDTYPDNDSATYNGAWNNYPFFPSGTVAIADINRGLFIVDVSNAMNYLTFSYPNGLPSTINPAGGTTVRVQVAARLAPVQPGTGHLHYDIGSGFVEVPMNEIAPNLYEAALPAAACGTTVKFYFSAENTLGVRYFDPLGAPTSYYSALAASSISVLVDDTFETNSGWTGGVAGDTAVTGQWVRVDPVGTAAQPEDDHTPAPGTMCWVTGQGAVGGSVGAADVDGGFTTLLSPAYDLTATPDALISYWRSFSNDQGSAPNEDTFLVDLSTNNGSTWVNVETVGPSGVGTSAGWLYHQFKLSDIAPATTQVRLRFIAQDLGSGSVVEAAIDDFQIRNVICATPCPGDLDGNGQVNLSDVAILLANYGCTGGGCPGDLDGNGSTDLGDLATILSVFGVVCP